MLFVGVKILELSVSIVRGIVVALNESWIASEEPGRRRGDLVV